MLRYRVGLSPKTCFWLLLGVFACSRPATPASSADSLLPTDTLGRRLAACRTLATQPYAANTYEQYFENQPVLEQTNYFLIEQLDGDLHFLVRELVGSFQPEGSSATEYYLGEREIRLNDTLGMYPFYDLQIVDGGDTAYYTNAIRGALRLAGRSETKVNNEVYDLYQFYIYDPEDGIPENPKALRSRRPMQVMYWSPDLGNVRTYFGEGNFFDLKTSTLLKQPEVLSALKGLIRD